MLRLSTKRNIFGKHAVTLPDACQKYDTFLSDPRVTFADEPTNLEAQWRVFTQSQSYSPQVWNDAYLAAFALVANLELVTFDKGLARYPNVNCRILP
jgi:uncharacterized protein